MIAAANSSRSSPGSIHRIHAPDCRGVKRGLAARETAERASAMRVGGVSSWNDSSNSRYYHQHLPSRAGSTKETLMPRLRLKWIGGIAFVLLAVFVVDAAR